MKKIIILLITVSIMLTSCGKSAGLSNGGKKADNKIPVVNANTKSQPQKNNDTGNKTLANDTRTKNLPQKIDSNIKYSWTGDHMFEIISISVIAIAIAIGSIVWIIKNNNKSPQATEPEKQSQPSKPPEAKGQPRTPKPSRKLMPLPVVDPLSFTVPFDLISFFTSPPANGDYDDTDLSSESEFALVYFYIYDKTILAGWRPPIKKELEVRGFDVSKL